MMSNNKHYEHLHSNSLQFAYKPNTSTVQCISSIIETIYYYLDKKVKYLFIFASKAFDKVNLLVLFNKLYKKTFMSINSAFINEQLL